MSIKMKTDIFETGVFFLISLSVIGLGFYFYDILFLAPTEDNPFFIYNANPGIINNTIASITCRVVFIILFLALSTESYNDSVVVKSLYLLSALVIGFLQWYELYYGSTFYYGEVRDKQGLMFPWLASLLVTLVIWKINYSKANPRNVMVKIILTVLINVGLFFLWRQVYEPWNLWQS